MNAYVVTAEQNKLLSRMASDLSVQAGAQAVIITDYMGNIMANISFSDPGDIQTIAALAAGSFAATQELARRVGEKEFSSILHRGSDKSIFIQSILSDFLFLVVFDEKTSIGLVKLYVEKAAAEAEPLIRAILSQDKPANEAGSLGGFELDSGADPFSS